MSEVVYSCGIFFDLFMNSRLTFDLEHNYKLG